MEQLWFTEILNHLFAGPVTAFLRMLHIEPKHAQTPISNSFAMELLVFAFLVSIFLLVRSRLSVESPGGLQHSFEAVEDFVLSQSREIIGHHSEPYTPFFAIVFIFILTCNLIGLIPGFESPTAVSIVPLGLRNLRVSLLPYPGIQTCGIEVPSALFRSADGRDADLGADSTGDVDAADRTRQQLRPSAVAYSSTLGQHFRRRSDHAGILFHDPDSCPRDLHRPAHRGRIFAGVCVHASDDYLRLGRGRRGALGVSGQLSALDQGLVPRAGNWELTAASVRASARDDVNHPLAAILIRGETQCVN